MTSGKSGMIKLAACLGGRDNNLNLIRMLAASAVIVSHAYLILSGDPLSEPLIERTGLSLGKFAVVVFFGMSGLLIAQSFDRKVSLIDFAIARIARLWPALTVSLLLTTLIIGPLTTTLPLKAYWRAPQTMIFFMSNLALVKREIGLPGVFEHTPLPLIVNGSLWSLFYEVCCYGAVVIAGLAGLLRRRQLLLIIIGAFMAAHPFIVLWQPPVGLAFRVQLLAYIGYPFALGMGAYAWREKIPLGLPLVIACWLLVAVVWSTWLLQTALMTAAVYTALWLAFIPHGPLRHYNIIGDYSYGLYVYAFPVQQALMNFFPDLSVLSHLGLSFPIIALLSMASWHFIEKPALLMARGARVPLHTPPPSQSKQGNPHHV